MKQPTRWARPNNRVDPSCMSCDLPRKSLRDVYISSQQAARLEVGVPVEVGEGR